MNLFLLDVTTPIIPSGGGGAVAPVVDGAAQAAQQAAPAGAFGGNPFTDRKSVV